MEAWVTHYQQNVAQIENLVIDSCIYVHARFVPPPIYSTTTDILMKECSVYGGGVPVQSELEDVYDNLQWIDNHSFVECNARCIGINM